MRAAIYVRVSTQEQAESGTSLATQRQRCISYVESRGWETAEVFAEEGVSGTAVSRPALDRLMAAARSGEVEAIVVTKLDRLGRSSRLLENMLGDMDELGVTFVSLSESIDSSSASGRLFRSMLGNFAAFEREMILDRTVAGSRAVASQGYWPGGPPPFGLRVTQNGDHKGLVLDEREAETLRTAAKLIVEEGCTTGEACARLNALGFKPRRAVRWGHQNLRRQLKQPYLTGTYTWAKQDAPGYRRYGKYGPPIEIQTPIVLDRETFDALQTALGVRSAGPVRQTHTYPLSGRLIGICGEAFIGAFRKDRGGGRREYRCKGARHTRSRNRCEDVQRIIADQIEDAVWGEVSGVLSEPKRLLAMAHDYLGLRGQQVEVERDQIEVIDSKIASLERAVANAYTEGLKVGLDGSALKLATTQLNEELAAARRHRAQMEAWQADAEAESSRMRKLWELADAAHRRMADMSPEEKATVLDLLDVRVQVTGYAPLRIRIQGVVDEGLLDDLDNRASGVVGRQGLEPCPPD